MIDFVSDDVHRYAAPSDFYGAAIRLMNAGYDGEATIDAYIASADVAARSGDDLRRQIAICLHMTPAPGFAPASKGVDRSWCFRDEWNDRQFVWIAADAYWLMDWGTSA